MIFKTSKLTPCIVATLSKPSKTAGINLLIGLMLLAISFSGCTQQVPPPPAAVGPTPTARQLEWHKLEQYAFIHFTTNTFTGKEWGFGDESPTVFNPTNLDPEQWAKTIQEAGLKGIILTCKHHDGFCLWPSEYTEHDIANSPYKNGKGNVVEEVYQACKKYGLKFGVYLSPWDRNHPDYGTPAYVEYYRNQLKELFHAYGPVFEMWFDGANGGDGYYGGANEKRKIEGATYYDWPTTLKMIREIEPEVIFFSDAGPDIRWCGNERGFVGETNWNTISTDTLYAGKPGITELLNRGSEDGTNWVPAEVDVSIRPGWFYHAHEDDKVRSAENLFKIYLESVGRGSNLLLNLPPDRRGLIHENDVASLRKWKAMLDEAFANNLAANAPVKASATRGEAAVYGAQNLTDSKPETYWTTDDNQQTAELLVELGQEQTISYVLLQEYIQLGQRVKAFSLEANINGTWKKIGEATTIGYKRIVPVDEVKTSQLRIRILDSKACPVLSNLEVY
ncbi:alpha-L-fucosidase [Sunxiuqinia sp. sy24]|uniref:alpha-L-fucosidase n=1 Tax=Sunxiuqinia sp. sy24 TaxID=3461495 RepID=UPI0040463A16